MPNKQTHIISSIVVIIVACTIFGFNILTDYLLHSLLFIVGSVFPDIIEPAYSYKHRQFFHSRDLFKILCYSILPLFMFGFFFNELFYIFAFVAGYILHLLMDSKTTMGLP